jgi:predicted membrane protein (TIGR00267 family)
MKDPDRALDEMVREELKLGADYSSPMREAVLTGVATAVGAFIPVMPFFFLGVRAAAWTSFVIAMVAHFGVGAARSIFTGRGILRSGIDMFVVGLGVAAVAYVIGDVLVRFLSGS